MMMIGGNNQMSSATQNEGGDGSSSTAGGMNNNHNNGGGGGGGGGEGGGGDGVLLKKGPWTAAEDAVLADYVRTHGEGNWNAVQKNTGLARCGKSCRLRWANHLRPNLKKGSFSPEEERIIVELHAKMGNKWARMATQLPGRTDNEIKNYWNTRVKRRQRQGLPLYPPDIQPLYSQHQHHHSTPTTPLLSPSNTPTSSFSFQTTPTTTNTTMSLHSSMLTPLHPLHIPRSESQPLLCNPHTAPTPSPLPSPSPSTPPPLPSPSPSTPPHASPLQSPHRPAFSTLPLFDYSTSHTCNNNTSTTTTNVTNTTTPSDFFYPRTSPTLQTPIRYKRFRHDASESNNNNHHNLNIAVNNGSFSTGSSFMVPFSPFMKSAAFNPHIGAVTTSTTSLASPQYTSYSLDPITLDLASSTRILRPHFDSGQLIPTPGYVYPSKTELPSNQLMSHGGNLEVTLDHTKGNNDYSSNDHSINHQNFSMNTSGSGLLEDMLEEAQVLADNNDIMRRQSCLVGFSSISDSVFKAKEETPEQMNTTTQEDYNRLLNPSSMAIPEWYNDSGEGSNGQSSVITDDNQGLDMHHLASLLPVDIAPDHHHGRSPSSRSWENFL